MRRKSKEKHLRARQVLRDADGKITGYGKEFTAPASLIEYANMNTPGSLEVIQDAPESGKETFGGSPTWKITSTDAPVKMPSRHGRPKRKS